MRIRSSGRRRYQQFVKKQAVLNKLLLQEEQISIFLTAWRYARYVRMPMYGHHMGSTLKEVVVHLLRKANHTTRVQICLGRPGAMVSENGRPVVGLLHVYHLGPGVDPLSSLPEMMRVVDKAEF